MNFINKLIAVAFAVIAFAGAANAQSIHMLVDRGNGHLYEINPNINIGGAYQLNPHWVGPIPVYGYTDRVSRGQYLGAVVLGKGVLQDLGIEVKERTVCLKRNVTLPYGWVDAIPLSPSWSNMDIFCHMNGRLVEVHVPIGSR